MKFMITSKEKPKNHPINVVHTDLESFILYNDSGLIDVDNQPVEIKHVPNIFNTIRKVLEGKRCQTHLKSHQTRPKKVHISHLKGNGNFQII